MTCKQNSCNLHNLDYPSKLANFLRHFLHYSVTSSARLCSLTCDFFDDSAQRGTSSLHRRITLRKTGP